MTMHCPERNVQAGWPPQAARELLHAWERGDQPVLKSFLNRWPGLSPSELAAVVRVDQRERWDRGERIAAESYLNGFADLAADAELAIDVVYHEFLIRERIGEHVDQVEYERRFPPYAAVLGDQIALHLALSPATMPADCDAETDGANRSIAASCPVSLNSSKALPTVSGYDIIRELGRGGMGIVYEARHRGLKRRVALKMVKGGDFVGADQLDRFRIEAEAVALLHHPNIVQIYDYGESDGLPYLALEILDGGTLAQRLKGTSWPIDDAAQLIASLAHALQFAHERGVIHRDLKPANILLERNAFANNGCRGGAGKAKIADFGLAKALSNADLTQTESGSILGTPNYISPEQAAGRLDLIGPPADVYSLGAVLYELLTGSPPFKARTALETLHQVLTDEPNAIHRLRPGVPCDLVTICMKCLQKDPAARYTTAHALAEDLDCFLTDRPILARQTSALERVVRWSRRYPVVAALCSCVVALLMVVAAISTFYSLRLRTELVRKERAEIAERHARQEAQLRLWESYLAEIAARRASRQIGQRFVSLERIKQARTVLDEIGPTPERVMQVRNAALSSLALADMRIVRSWTDETLQGAPIAVASIADRYAAVADGSEVVVYRLSDNRPVSRIKCPAAVETLELNASGNLVAMESREGVIVWRINQKEPQCVWQGKGARNFTFAPGGAEAALGSPEGPMQLFDTETFERKRDLGRGVAESKFAFHADTRRIAVCTDHTVQIHSWDTGEVLADFEVKSDPASVVWHPSGDFIAVGGTTSGIVLYDIGSGRLVQTYPHFGAVQMTFIGDGASLLSQGLWDAHLRLWETGTGTKQLESLTLGRIASELSSEGELLVQDSNGRRMNLWRVYSGAESRALFRASQVDLGGPLNTAMNPDGSLLAIGRERGFDVWDLNNLRQVAHCAAGPAKIGFDSNGSMVVALSSGVFKLPLQIGDSQANVIADDRHAISVNYGPLERLAGSFDPLFVAICPDGRMFGIRRSQGWSLVSTSLPNEMKHVATGHDSRCAAISTDHRWLAAAGWNDRNTLIINCQTAQPVTELMTGFCGAVCFSPDNRWLATSPDGVRLWRVQDWQPARAIAAIGSTPMGLGLSFSPDSQVLAVGQPDGVLRLVDISTGHDLAALSHPDLPSATFLNFLPDQSKLVAISTGRDVAGRVWDLVALRQRLEELELNWSSSSLDCRATNIEVKRIHRITIDSEDIVER